MIRRIDELQKTAQGNVAAKVVSFYESGLQAIVPASLMNWIKPPNQRGRDIPTSLGHLADKHANDLAEEMRSADVNFNEIEKHQLRHREVWGSKKVKN